MPTKQKAFLFETEDAEKYGVEAAVVLHAIRFWIEKNRANNRHFHDGRTWTYNSTKGWADLFPFFSERRIRTILDRLVEIGVLVKGNYNEQRFDRTLWYAFAEDGESNSENRQMHLPQIANGCDENREPIPEYIPELIPEIKEKEITKVISKEKSTTPYGEFGEVHLTDEEYKRALEKYDGDPDKLAFAIQLLDEWLVGNDKAKKKTKSCYITLVKRTNWIRKRVDEEYVPRRYIEKDFDDRVIKVF